MNFSEIEEAFLEREMNSPEVRKEVKMPVYQALFEVLFIFFLGDAVSRLTRARISSMFVIMVMFLALFMSGIFPSDIMSQASLDGIASVAPMFLLFNMGTTINFRELLREWRTVLTALIGMIAALLGCIAVIPVVGFSSSLAAAPVVNGGIIATTTMVDACNSSGLPQAAAFATFVYAIQKFVGTLPASSAGLREAKRMLLDVKENDYLPEVCDLSKDVELSHNHETGDKKIPFWMRYEDYYTTFVTLAIASLMIYLAYLIGNVFGGWINMAIWVMLAGVLCRQIGLVPPNVLRDKAKASGFFAFASLCTIIPSLAKVQLSDIPSIGGKLVILFASVLVFTFLIFCLTPAWKLCGSKSFAIGIAMCQMIGYPGTELIANEISNAASEDPNERDYVSERIRTAYVISGFTSVSLLSVLIASVLANLI